MHHGSHLYLGIEMCRYDSKVILDLREFLSFIALTVQTGLASEDSELQPRWQDASLGLRGSLHRHR